MTKILIIRFSSIGDIIQCMSIINGIENRFPDAEIHWVTRKDMSSFLAIDKRIHKIWAFDKQEGLRGLLKLAGKLKEEHFEYIYDAHSNIRSNILRLKLLSPFKSHPKCVVRHKERGKRFLLFHFGINHFEWPFRGVKSYREPLRKWGVNCFTPSFSNWSFPEAFEKKFTDRITPGTVTLIPSANWEMKRWPVGHWKKLIAQLPEYNFLILAGPADIFCEEISAVAPGRVSNLTGKTSLLESCYIVSQSNIVISADTGFMHAADLFQVQTLALIGPTAFGFPTGDCVETLEVPLACRPCTKDGRGKCKQAVYQKCMVDITPEWVAQRVRHFLPIDGCNSSF